MKDFALAWLASIAMGCARVSRSLQHETEGHGLMNGSGRATHLSFFCASNLLRHQVIGTNWITENDHSYSQRKGGSPGDAGRIQRKC
jgi:hypothetical protein